MPTKIEIMTQNKELQKELKTLHETIAELQYKNETQLEISRLKHSC